MNAPKVSAYIATSLDGFIAREDGSIDFLDAVQMPDEDYGFAEFMDRIDTLVVGRKTHETVLGFEEWPFEGKRVVVMSTKPGRPVHGERFATGEPIAVLEELAREGARHVYVDGGETIRGFLRAGVVDAMTISIVPTLLGRGRRLFDESVPPSGLVLDDARAYASGLVQLRYRLAR